MNEVLVGFNYWPSNGMYMWKDFRLSKIKEDLYKIKELNMNCVRIFIIWEDFQDSPNSINYNSFEKLHEVLKIAKDLELRVILTIFQGHMSGANWLPSFAIDFSKSTNFISNFPVICSGKKLLTPADCSLKDIYTDPVILRAQEFLTKELVTSFKDLVYCWDIANEIDNVLIPTSSEVFNDWLRFIVYNIRKYHNDSLITIGTHSENLEKNKNVDLVSVSNLVDVISMHGYPIYSSFSDSDLDSNYVPLLYFLSRVLTGKQVWFTEFGLPSLEKELIVKVKNICSF